MLTTEEEFERIGGFYGTGYRSELRRCLYHGKGEIPSKDWQREIRRLHHLIKSVSSELKLPELREYPVREVPPDDLYVRPIDDAWKESKFDAVVARR